jgi:hypothetical protein
MPFNSHLAYDDYHRQNSCPSMYGTAHNIGKLAEKRANARSGQLKNWLVKVRTFFSHVQHDVRLQGFLKKE